MAGFLVPLKDIPFHPAPVKIQTRRADLILANFAERMQKPRGFRLKCYFLRSSRKRIFKVISEPGSGEQIVADEEKFLGRSRIRACVIEECVTAG